ncbi:GntR family transcriptional regulator [Streptacidiphilus sp. N1-12]|uniref:GntR family transcriptional regulator n=2 Tax=Streptacidiphilus alkalitolerans TaxID=3342712 RepID=A0ABV6WCK0_9ACTN
MAQPEPRRQVLADTVHDTIRQRLLEHAIEPGSKLNINALALELEVSPTPVREALARLEADGLVLKRTLAGYTAAPLLSGQEFDELFELRMLLEPAAAARAAERADAADLRALAGQLAEMREARAAGPDRALQSFVRQDALFHDRIAAAGGNGLLRGSLERLHAHTHLYRLYFREGIAEETCREHERILDTLREHDADAAAATMRTHLRRARERLLGALPEALPDAAR